MIGKGADNNILCVYIQNAKITNFSPAARSGEEVAMLEFRRDLSRSQRAGEIYSVSEIYTFCS